MSDAPILQIQRIATLPGLFITGTDTNVGKTIIAAAIARWFVDRSLRVGVCKIAATGCERRREGLVSEDAEILAHAADSRFPLDVIAPIRYAEPLAPAVAAERAGEPLDWALLHASLSRISRESDVMVVEGVGGILVPMDERYTVLDVAKALGFPVVIVARAGLGTINHTLLSICALRHAGVPIAGVVVNQYSIESDDLAQESNPAAIAKWGKVPVLCLAPREAVILPKVSPGVMSAIEQVDWMQLARG